MGGGTAIFIINVHSSQENTSMEDFEQILKDTGFFAREIKNETELEALSDYEKSFLPQELTLVNSKLFICTKEPKN